VKKAKISAFIIDKESVALRQLSFVVKNSFFLLSFY